MAVLAARCDGFMTIFAFIFHRTVTQTVGRVGYNADMSQKKQTTHRRAHRETRAERARRAAYERAERERRIEIAEQRTESRDQSEFALEVLQDDYQNIPQTEEIYDLPSDRAVEARSVMAKRPPMRVRGSDGKWHLRLASVHDAADFGAVDGSKAPVNAAAEGVVLYAGWHDNASGTAVVIFHPKSKDITTYSHITDIPAELVPGTPVKRGQTIGLMGNEGNVTSKHADIVHYKQYKAPDAEWVLSRRRDGKYDSDYIANYLDQLEANPNFSIDAARVEAGKKLANYRTVRPVIGGHEVYSGDILSPKNQPSLAQVQAPAEEQEVLPPPSFDLINQRLRERANGGGGRR